LRGRGRKKKKTTIAFIHLRPMSGEGAPTTHILIKGEKKVDPSNSVQKGATWQDVLGTRGDNQGAELALPKRKEKSVSSREKSTSNFTNIMPTNS